MLGYIRVCTVVPSVTVADPTSNLNSIINKLAECQLKSADIVLLPELSLTGFSCGDLFNQKVLLDLSKKQLIRLVRSSRDFPFAVVIGAPLLVNGKLYDCAVIIACGRIYGIVPRHCIDGTLSRWFSSYNCVEKMYINSSDLGLNDVYNIPFGSKLIFNINGCVSFAAVLGDDALLPINKSSELALCGAQIILDLSADKGMVSAYDKRKAAILSLSRNLNCAYIYTSAGADESTSDCVYCGSSIIAENGKIIDENSNTVDSDYIICADIDLDIITCERLNKQSFYNSSCDAVAIDSKIISFCADGRNRMIDKYPFIPTDKELRIKHCKEVFDIQVSGLKRRLSITGCKPVIGVSGGLDSTLALLVCIEAVRQLGRPASDVIGITMPCFGTSNRTYNNAVNLIKLLGATFKEISVKDACLQHFEDIEHDPLIHDTTYENCQARERTQVLMDYAGKVGGLVVGTGDLSELALGWCTYNGDHISMYSVNADIPKTLISCIIAYLADVESFAECGNVLRDIIDTPISPELLPPDADGVITQQTEDVVGPYSLHDFFIFYTLKYGFSPKKVFNLAINAFAGEYTEEYILKWLKTFYRRFFSQQFKRNCTPDGVKVGNISLSSKQDWLMPSDASANLWLREVDEL